MDEITYTENKMSSIWQVCHHQWHRKLLLWQITVPPNDNKIVELITFCYQCIHTGITVNLC